MVALGLGCEGFFVDPELTSPTVSGLTSIQVSTADGLTSIPYGGTEQFVATGRANGEQIDITNSVLWSTSPGSCIKHRPALNYSGSHDDCSVCGGVNRSDDRDFRSAKLYSAPVTFPVTGFTAWG
jgi:hypothetical protein